MTEKSPIILTFSVSFYLKLIFAQNYLKFSAKKAKKEDKSTQMEVKSNKKAISSSIETQLNIIFETDFEKRKTLMDSALKINEATE